MIIVPFPWRLEMIFKTATMNRFSDHKNVSLRELSEQQQQQQQHTLLTFPKGAFQRQCYKNNPITIKKSYLQLKMF